MIYDKFDNIRRYQSLIPQLKDILDFVSQNDLSRLPAGEIVIDDKDLFARVLEYVPKKASENNFETHRLYMDVQLVIRGVEIMQVTGEENLHPVTEYDEKGDYRFFSADKGISDIVVKENEFAVFAPGEAHKPGCRYQDFEQETKKIVFKVKITR